MQLLPLLCTVYLFNYYTCFLKYLWYAQPCYCGSENCRGVIGGRSKAKNGELNGSAKRKVGTKLPGVFELHAAAVDPALRDKMKAISRKERTFIQSHNIFLNRNYEKLRLRRLNPETRIADRLEKIMTPWASRFKVSSSKNKPLILENEDPRVIEMAKIAQVFHELLATLISGKGKLKYETNSDVCTGNYFAEAFFG